MFYFGSTKVTEKGFKVLKDMNLTRMEKFMLQDLYLSEGVVSEVFNSIHVPKLT
jgi:hypothetical protein